MSINSANWKRVAVTPSATTFSVKILLLKKIWGKRTHSAYFLTKYIFIYNH